MDPDLLADIVGRCVDRDPDLQRLCRTLRSRSGLTAEASDRSFDGIDFERAAHWPDLLVRVRELVLSAEYRKGTGAHYTPPAVADHVADHVIEPSRAPSLVWDPACGGGAFLLSAARRLAETMTPVDAVGRLVGCDIDPIACRVARTALQLWCGTALDVEVVRGDALVDENVMPSSNGAAALANPPFLSPLLDRTRSGHDREDVLAQRFGSRRTAYTNEASLFVSMIVDWLPVGGRAGVVLPRSVLSSRDANPMREHLEETASVEHLWSDEAEVFDASVSVCAIVVSRGAPQRLVGRSVGLPPRRRPPVGLEDWAALLLSADDVPVVSLDESTPMSTVATATAGFRDEYYVLDGLVAERSSLAADVHPVVTSGAIDVLHDGSTDRAQRYAKRKWNEPVVGHGELAALAAKERAARWHCDSLRPKVLVASQTKLIEAIADPEGGALAITPVVMVMPKDGSISVWMLVAALSAPPVSAWLRRRYAGSGMSRDTIRVSARALDEVPVPVDVPDWHAAASVARHLHETTESGPARLDLLTEFAVLSTRSYRVDDRVVGWWLDLARANWRRSGLLD